MILSGNHYYSSNGSFEVTQLRAGSHYLTVASKQRGRQAGHRNNLAFRGRIFIPQQSVVYATITPRGRLVIDQVRPMRRFRGNNQRGQGRSGYGRHEGQSRNDHRYRDYNQGRDWNYDGYNGRGQGRGQGQGRDQRDGNDWNINTNRGGGNGGYRNSGNRDGQAGSTNINFLLDQIANTTFESDKKIVAKQLIDSRPLYSNEVLMIMEEMTYESTKLEIAKYAYNNTLDKQNYTIVNQGFTYSSSIKKLDRFIRQ
jgi:hypothetical protein